MEACSARKGAIDCEHVCVWLCVCVCVCVCAATVLCEFPTHSTDTGAGAQSSDCVGFRCLQRNRSVQLWIMCEEARVREFAFVSEFAFVRVCTRLAGAGGTQGWAARFSVRQRA